MSYAAALLVAGVLAWAGVSKLSRPLGTAASFAGLGLPAPGLLARVVPLVEVAAAAALVVVPRLGAAAALALLLAFTVVLAAAVARGAEVGCACFGSARARPVSIVELARNGGLMALAGLALGADGPEVPSLAGVIVVTTAFAVGLIALSLADLRREVGSVWSNRLPGEVR